MSNLADDLYFIRAGDFVKIGRTRNLEQRLVSIQTGCPHPITSVVSFPGRGADERAVHRRLQEHRAHGEWFRWSDRIEAEISLIRNREQSGSLALSYLKEIVSNGTYSPLACQMRAEARKRLSV